MRRLGKQMQVAPHRHDWAQVAICIAGATRITAGEGTYLVPSSRAVWIPPGVEHCVTAVESVELCTLYVHQGDGIVGPGVAGPDRDAWRQCRVVEVSPLLRELALQLDACAGDGEPPDAAAGERERRLADLSLDELRRAAPLRLGLTLPHDKRLRALCEAVLADPHRHATLEAWAGEVGASPRTLARLFREQLDTSFAPWREQALLARALTLAAQGRPIGLIAAELGYASASAFSAMVRRAVGQPPRQFFADAAGR
jgi:AraC-like DNA-binding protein